MAVRKNYLALAGSVAASLAAAANAASPLSNSLSGFAGNSTLPATQTALAAAGLEFASTAGLNPEFTLDPTVLFDAGGAQFGVQLEGDGGRNYIRTTDSDFAAVSFVAEVTFELTMNTQSVFIGLGAGDIALWGTPDWSTQTASASFWFEPGIGGFYRFKTQNDNNTFDTTTIAGIYTGTHRFRMTFDATAGELLGEIDVNYAGGPFVADIMTNNAPIPTAALFAADGWPSEPSRIFFGGDDGARFRDLSIITVIPEPAAGAFVLIAATACLGVGNRRR